MNEREILKEAGALCGDAVRDLAPRFGIEPSPSRRERARELMAEYEAHRVATDAAIEDWLVHGRFSHSLSEEVMRCAFLRFAGVEFLYRGAVPASALQSLPLPHQTAKGLLRHLLVELWSASRSWPRTWLRDFDLGRTESNDEEP